MSVSEQGHKTDRWCKFGKDLALTGTWQEGNLTWESNAQPWEKFTMSSIFLPCLEAFYIYLPCFCKLWVKYAFLLFIVPNCWLCKLNCYVQGHFFSLMITASSLKHEIIVRNNVYSVIIVYKYFMLCIVANASNIHFHMNDTASAQ